MFDFDFNNLSENAKAALNGVPFLAGAVTSVETPYYTKLLQTVITFCVVGLIGYSATVVMANRDRGELMIQQQAILDAKVTNSLAHLTNLAAENKGDIKALQEKTRDRIYRSEWSAKNNEQDNRILRLERAVK